MASLLSELKRRNVFRVALAYVVVGWVVLQVAETLAPLMHLPEWTVSLTLYIGIIGFPFALLFAWAFELTPDGFKRSHEVPAEESITHITAGHINRILTLLLLIALGLLASERWLQQDGAESSSDTNPTAIETTDTVATPQAAPRSIAVLPFVNMSNDPEQEYFSDGISEELLNDLARIGELRVAARTSSFAFKGKNQPVPDIGRQLKVETVLEGSVRKSGQRIRITAQLINVADGYHLWSDTYDRDLTDIFAIQDEISAAIVDALRVHLDAPEEEQANTANVEAYNLLLLARHLVKQRTETSLLNARDEYQKALDIDPDYAEAWAGKALCISLLSTDSYGNIPLEAALREAQSYVDRALAIDPGQGLAHAVQGLIYLSQHRNQAALDSFEQALERNPNEGILVAWQALALDSMGRGEDGLEVKAKAFELDPLHPVVRDNYFLGMAESGRFEEVRGLLIKDSAEFFRAKAVSLWSEGRSAEAYSLLQQALAEDNNPRRSTDRILTTVLLARDLVDPLAAIKIAFPGQARYIHATIEPAKVLEELGARSFSANVDLELATKLEALTALDRKEEALAALAPRGFAHTPLYGRSPDKTSGAWLAFWEVFLLDQLGRTEESRALARRILAFIDKSQGSRPAREYAALSAPCHLLLGEEAAALRALEEGIDHFTVGWVDLNRPWWDPLRQHPHFTSLQDRVRQQHDDQRQQLNWKPVDWSQPFAGAGP